MSPNTSQPTIAILAGSLRPDGLSAAAAEEAALALPAPFQAARVDFAGFPLYHPGLHLGEPGHPEGEDLPEPVRRAFLTVRDSAGVLIVTPEYNYGIPGGLKNALDWLSRPAYKSVFAGRHVAVMSTSPGPAGGLRAQAALKRVLGGMVAEVFTYPEVGLAGVYSKRGDDGRLQDERARKHVAALVEAFTRRLGA